MRMCEVEVVVKDIDGASFHAGLMIDVNEQAGTLLVQLLGGEGAQGEGEQRWLPRNAMRLKRPSEAPPGFLPQVSAHAARS